MSDSTEVCVAGVDVWRSAANINLFPCWSRVSSVYPAQFPRRRSGWSAYNYT